MTQHDGLPVKGYTSQSSGKVVLVNENKILEERVLRQIDYMKSDRCEGVDGRMLAIAHTNIQQAFMWMNRAVFQPERINLPEDVKPSGDGDKKPSGDA